MSVDCKAREVELTPYSSCSIAPTEPSPSVGSSCFYDENTMAVPTNKASGGRTNGVSSIGGVGGVSCSGKTEIPSPSQSSSKSMSGAQLASSTVEMEGVSHTKADLELLLHGDETGVDGEGHGRTRLLRVALGAAPGAVNGDSLGAAIPVAGPQHDCSSSGNARSSGGQSARTVSSSRGRGGRGRHSNSSKWSSRIAASCSSSLPQRSLSPLRSITNGEVGGVPRSGGFIYTTTTSNGGFAVMKPSGVGDSRGSPERHSATQGERSGVRSAGTDVGRGQHGEELSDPLQPTASIQTCESENHLDHDDVDDSVPILGPGGGRDVRGGVGVNSSDDWSSSAAQEQWRSSGYQGDGGWGGGDLFTGSGADERLFRWRVRACWYCGAMLLVLGSLVNFASFGFAPQSLLASLGSVQFVSNVVFGKVRKDKCFGF